MNMIIEVENIKCGGCASSISSKMKSLPGITDVLVDIEAGKVSLQGELSRRDDYANTLASMGYPEVGTLEGLQSAGAKAKSFVSCAIGRVK